MALNSERRPEMLSQLLLGKENLPPEVSSIISTPGRRPLKSVQENVVGTPESLNAVKKRTIRFSQTPNALNQKRKRKSKGYGIPVQVFRRSLKPNARLTSPLACSSKEPKPSSNSDSKDDLKGVKKSKFSLESSGDVVEVDASENTTENMKNKEKELDFYAESIVNNVFRNITKVSDQKTSSLCVGNQKIEIQEEKIQEFTKIILQMNKERLDLEKQLQICKKKSLIPQGPPPKSKNYKRSVNTTSKSQLNIEKELSKKTMEVNQLKREIQKSQTSKHANEAKGEELKQLKVELHQLQLQVREVSTLKNELHKARQQVTQLNEVVFSSRRENTSQKTLIGKLQKEISSKELRAKLHLDECGKHTEKLQSELDEKKRTVALLKQSVEENDQGMKIYQHQCENLAAVIGRLETVSLMAEKFKSLAERKVKDLSSALEAKAEECENLEVHLQNARNDSLSHRQKCENLNQQVSYLTSEVDIGHMEISRQHGVIADMQQTLEQLRVENSMYQEHLELIQCQQQETNEFLWEEKKTLEETAREMEKELSEKKEKEMQLDITFREKSMKCYELEEKVKLSRSLYQDKQEELDATQSQAHCIMLQLQNEITDAQQALEDAWNVLGPLLNKFRGDAQVNCQENKQDSEQDEPSSPSQALPPSSLVQSVLAAVAMGTNADDSEDDVGDSNDEETVFVTLGSQISELKKALLELADIGYGHAASRQAQEEIVELEQAREAMEENHNTKVNKLQFKLENSQVSEATLKNDIQRQRNKIESLTSALQSTREDLQQTMEKKDSLSNLLVVEIEQRRKITILTDDLQRKEDDYRKLQSDNECIEQQLKEAVCKVDEICGSKDSATNMPAKLLHEKLAMERKLKQVKDKWMEYRLGADGSLDRHKITSSREIAALGKNLQRAESEIYRLDEILEKIRKVLQKNLTVVSECPPLYKVLQFLDGDESNSH